MNPGDTDKKDPKLNPHASYRWSTGPVVCLIEDGQFLSFSIYGWWYLSNCTLTLMTGEEDGRTKRREGEKKERLGIRQELSRGRKEKAENGWFVLNGITLFSDRGTAWYLFAVTRSPSRTTYRASEWLWNDYPEVLGTRPLRVLNEQQNEQQLVSLNTCECEYKSNNNEHDPHAINYKPHAPVRFIATGHKVSL